MQRTADFHHQIANPRFPYPDGLFEHAAAFDTAVDAFDAHAPPRYLPILRFLRPRQLMPAGLFRRLNDGDTVQREGLKAQILEQLTPHGQQIRRRVGTSLVVHTARMRCTEEQDVRGPIDAQEVFQHVPSFLSAIPCFLFSRIVGARDGSLGPVLTKRGGGLGTTAGTASVGEASPGRAGPVPLSCSRRASTWRQGASPKVRSVFRKTGNKT
jgi:hypothetical protein